MNFALHAFSRKFRWPTSKRLDGKTHLHYPANRLKLSTHTLRHLLFPEFRLMIANCRRLTQAIVAVMISAAACASFGQNLQNGLISTDLSSLKNFTVYDDQQGSSTGIKLQEDSTVSVGSAWDAHLINNRNDRSTLGQRGFQLFNLPGEFKPLPGSKFQLLTNNYGSCRATVCDEATANTHNLHAFYTNSSSATTDVYNRTDYFVSQIEGTHLGGPSQFTFDITEGFSKLPPPSQGQNLGLRYSGSSPAAFEDFGRGAIRAWDSPIEVIANSLKFEIGNFDETTHLFTNDPMGRAIVGSFTPTGSLGYLDMSSVASALEVEQFRWIQRVVEVPESWSAFEVYDLTFDGKGYPLAKLNANGDIVDTTTSTLAQTSSVRLPIVDPVVLDSTKPGTPTLFYRTGDGKLIWWANEPESLDALPFYFTSDEIEDGAFRFGNALFFEDTPSQPEGTFLPGESILFETSLAGVRTDGTYIEWNGRGTRFRWRSNVEHKSPETGNFRIGYFKTLGDFPEQYASGGIFNIRSDRIVVPEPSSIVFVVIAGSMATRLARRRVMLTSC